MKSNSDIYDDFYAQAYDVIHKPIPRANYELIQIINTTHPSVKNSVFLDVGSGTGEIVHRLKELGYRAYGIDRSNAMIRASREKYPNLYIVQGDIMDPMKYEKDTFTHLLCTYFTIYSIPDKQLFFRYCFSWLKTGGFLVLHLVDRNRFNMNFLTMPQKNSTPEPYDVFNLLSNLLANRSDTTTDFNGVKYESNYNNENVGKNVATWKERFTDKRTGKIRENEHHLYMESKETILMYAKECGFVVKKEIDFKDRPNEVIMILIK